MLLLLQKHLFCMSSLLCPIRDRGRKTLNCRMLREMKQVYKKVVCEAEQDQSTEAQKEGDFPQGLRKELWRYHLSLTLKDGFTNGNWQVWRGISSQTIIFILQLRKLRYREVKLPKVMQIISGRLRIGTLNYLILKTSFFFPPSTSSLSLKLPHLLQRCIRDVLFFLRQGYFGLKEE